ncbi:ABC transporter substrate-binding protein [Tianweitania sediminis]|uniref:ABC transporter substrate-binding protein n=1 Tax=Tianweitania sediminis TaxID=1502156 RepID=A0A8J7ULX8_9HYPH|nr:ABC transporter substrate-binding protein [Tianweitania sediminis]MBP0441420.1 ABC transporter substrate-binding protein [Tianweitania sediminis]
MMLNWTRRKILASAAAMTLALGVPAIAQDNQEIVIGGSIPLTGVFGFAGVGIEAGMQDYIKILNEEGGIDGRKVRLSYEDTGYKVDTSVAVFNKLTSQDEIHLYYGDSTGFAKTINPELDRRGTMIMAGASFASELNDPAKFPAQFLAGPDYTEMVSILLEFIAKEKPGATIMLVNSDTEFGRDPIAKTKERASALGLEVVGEIITPPTAVDVSTEVLKLRRARPDYAIFHGYILAPLPEFMNQAKQLGLETKFMGTFWSMDSSIWADVGEAANGFMGVMPYRYYYDTEAAPMLDKIREMRPQYQSTAYTQGFLTAMLLTEAAKRTLAAGQELNAKNLKASLNTIKDFDTGGLIGVPISIPGNSIPVGRIYQYDAAAKQMKPASDWISVQE